MFCDVNDNLRCGSLSLEGVDKSGKWRNMENVDTQKKKRDLFQI